jgi:hypothetical protein
MGLDKQATFMGFGFPDWPSLESPQMSLSRSFRVKLSGSVDGQWRARWMTATPPETHALPRATCPLAASNQGPAWPQGEIGSRTDSLGWVPSLCNALPKSQGQSPFWHLVLMHVSPMAMSSNIHGQKPLDFHVPCSAVLTTARHHHARPLHVMPSHSWSQPRPSSGHVADVS